MLVCDAGPGLLARKLHLYTFFRNPPGILLVRRGPIFPTDSGLNVETQRIHLPTREVREIGLLNTPLAILSVIGYLMHTLPIAMKLLRRRHIIRLVHAHFIFPQGLFGLVLASFCRVPLVISAVGDDVNVMLRRNALLRIMCRYVLAQAHVTIAVSIPLQRVLRQFGTANIVYLPNSVDTTAISPSGSPKGASILFVGHMTENKRPLMLLHAFQKIAAKVRDTTLTLCGDGPLRRALQDEVRQSELKGKVHLIPWTTPRHVIRLLSQAEIFVLPSRSEGLSNALLEAMAAGKVIIASSNESHREILRDGVDALLFHVDDEEDLTSRILLSLTDEQLRLRLSRSARELCLRQFSAREVGPELERIYLATAKRADKSSCP